MTPQPTDPFYSPREITYISPAGIRLSDYEAVTCHAQPDLGHFGTGGWFLLSDAGRPAFDPCSTTVRHPDWFEFRDPSEMWQRPYVAQLNANEHAVSATVEAAVAGDAFADIELGWAVEVLGRYYDAFACAEWGLFLALARCVRAALSDTLSTSLTLAALDRLRHQQDIALLSLELEARVPGYESLGRDCWLNDEMLAPTRLLVESLMATTDWVETMFVVGAIVDPLLCRLLLSRFFRRFAPANGDIITPAILLTVERDRDRTTATTAALVRMLTVPTPSGITGESSHNLRVMQGWLDKWVPDVKAALIALSPLFDKPKFSVDTPDSAQRYVEQRWATWAANLGLHPSR